MSDANDDRTNDDRAYLVVRNHEEQFSIWPADRTVPEGWGPVGTAGTRQECLDRIAETWTDMRPRSVRERLSTPAG
ncbi:MAG: MbtH family protein [Frankiaceae bacterium]